MLRDLDPLLRCWLLTTGLLLVVPVLTYLAWPAARPQFYAEDAALEWASAALFLASCAIGAVRMARAGWRPLAYLLVPLFGLLAALEELSYGERMFGWEMPYLGDVKVDGLHDLLEVVLRSAHKGLGLGPLLTALGLAAVLAGALAWRFRTALFDGFPYRLPLVFAGLTAAFLVGSSLIDLELFSTKRSVIFLEELGEAAAAWTWCFAAWSLRSTEPGSVLS